MNGVLRRYREYLPVTGQTPIFSIGEGDTPLVSVPTLATEIGCQTLHFKLEGCNPTGSFKDRGMVLAVAKAIEAGSGTVICASTGNTSASAAAYAAYGGLRATIMVPRGNIARGKLAQAIVYGATIINLKGNFDRALELVLQITEKHAVTLVNSLNPHRLQGQKTAAFEIVDALGDAPDYQFIPVGNAGNITAYWMGYREYRDAGKARTLPKMMGFQAAGAAPIVLGHAVAEPETVATAIRIGNPASWHQAEAARDESGGVIDSVSDAEILAAQQQLARQAGIFGEPASAASFAGLLKMRRQGTDFNGARITCIITGNGLKDTETAMGYQPPEMLESEPELAAIERALMLT